MRKAVVIGGSGFVGSHLVDALLLDGSFAVVNFDKVSSPYPSSSLFFQGSITDFEDLKKAFKGSDVVFHTASPPYNEKNKQIFHDVNVEATHKVVNACLECGVKRLILVSTASVVYSGKNLLEATEDLDYAFDSSDYYTQSKILQEKIVLEANTKSLSTVALRPHQITGPRDKLFVPIIIEAVQKKRLTRILGNGDNVVSFTDVGNLVHALMLCNKKIETDPSLAGQAYNISNNETTLMWTFYNDLFEALGYSRLTSKLPVFFMWIVCYILLFFTILFSWLITFQPSLTPYKVAILTTHHSYSCEKAIKYLKYQPKYSNKDTIQRIKEHFVDLRASSK